MPKVKGNDIDICRQRWEEIQRLTKEARIHEAEYARLGSSAEAFTQMVESLAKENDRLKTVNAELRVSVANQAGDNRCWLTETVSSGVPLPPWTEFQESCHRFHTQVTAEDGVLEGAKTIAQLEAENAEHAASFDLRHTADMNAIARWREDGPDRELILPDHADLCVWLLDQNERMTLTLKVAERALRTPCGESTQAAIRRTILAALEGK